MEKWWSEIVQFEMGDSVWIVLSYFMYRHFVIFRQIDQHSIRGNHKPRGQLRGGVGQRTILLHKPYLVKVTTKGVKNTQKFDHVVYGWPPCTKGYKAIKSIPSCCKMQTVWSCEAHIIKMIYLLK